METHGGFGRVYLDCYARAAGGVVFEKDPARCDVLARQRPHWAVYQNDCVSALGAGAGAHLVINFLDVDPYGDPWPTISAFFMSDRPRAELVVVAVNDGLRQKLKMNGGWDVASLAEMVARYGSAAMYRRYTQICAELMEEKALQAGYRLERWGAYYTGHAQQMTHYGAVLVRIALTGADQALPAEGE